MTKTPTKAAPKTAVGDSLRNFASGLNVVGRDKGASGNWAFTPLSKPELEAMYRGDWIARKVVKVPAEDMLREGRSWKAEKDFIEAFEAEWTRLGLEAKVFQALIWARLYGGAGIVIGDGTDDPSQPLDPASIKKGGIVYAVALPRHRLTVSEIEYDPASPYFGGPKGYQLTVPGGEPSQDIHPSRVIQFIAEPLPDQEITAGDALGWGDSSLQAIEEPIRHSAATSAALASLIQEAKTDVVKVPDLLTNIGTPEYQSRLTARFVYAAASKSITNALLIDGAEEWDQRQVTFTGIPDVARVFLEIVAGAADIPVTRLLGTSAKGLNATGEGDQSNYYDSVASMQTRVLAPAYARLDAMVAASATGKPIPDAAFYEFDSLHQLDDESAAKVAKLKAEIAQLLSDTALIPHDALAAAVQNSLIEDGTFPGFEAAIEAAKMELGEKPVDPNAPDPVELAAAMAAANDPGAGRPVTVNGPGGSKTANARRLPPGKTQDAASRPLYVSRRVLNAAAILSHFRAQGLESLTAPEDLHVTVAFSREPVDWFAMGSTWSGERDGTLRINPGGPRLVEPLGAASAVLLFGSDDLQWRHSQMRERGASWDFPEYQPHVTLSYAPTPDLAGVEPWKGDIVLGPEVFETLDGDDDSDGVSADDLPGAAEEG